MLYVYVIVYACMCTYVRGGYERPGRFDIVVSLKGIVLLHMVVWVLYVN